MFLSGVTGDQEIIYVVKTKVKTMQHLVHKALKGLTRIPEAKRHADKFI